MESNHSNQNSNQSPPRFYWIRLSLVYLLIPLILFLCSFDQNWWQAWVYAVLIVVVGVGGRYWAERKHPGLMAERMNFDKSPGVKSWDKVLALLVSVSVGFPLVIVAGLDHRYGWSPAFPLWLNIIGLLLAAAGYALVVWALVENRFFSSAVRIQTDRGHVVCDTGPYRMIRHPGYAGNIIPLAGIVLAFSSFWTIIPAAIASILILIRTVLEDRTLKDELPGYKEYAQKVRYRLFPGIW